MPRVMAAGLDSNNVEIKQNNQPLIVDTTSGITPEIEVAKSVADMNSAAFMHQELEVHFHDPANEHEHQFVEVNVNGDYRCIPRGTSGKLRRYHVAVLATSKSSRVVQKQVRQPDGSVGFQETAVLSLNYPFQVLEDPAGKQGTAWLKSLMSSPT